MTISYTKVERGAYVVSFSLYNHHLLKSGGDLTTLNMCHRTIRFYDTPITIVGGGVFTH